MNANEPSPEQIAAACLEIQATWTLEEKQRRLRVDLRPVVACADGRHVDVTAADYDDHAERVGVPCHE